MCLVDFFNLFEFIFKVRCSFSFRSLDLLLIDDDFDFCGFEEIDESVNVICCCYLVFLDICYDIISDIDVF